MGSMASSAPGGMGEPLKPLRAIVRIFHGFSTGLSRHFHGAGPASLLRSPHGASMARPGQAPLAHARHCRTLSKETGNADETGHTTTWHDPRRHAHAAGRSGTVARA